MTAVLWVALGSAFGAPARYVLDRLIQTRHERIFPWGTWVINVSGSFGLGLVTALAEHHALGSWVVPAVGVGFLGGYTTFSTFSWETLRLVEEGAVAAAVLNVTTTLAMTLAAAAAGLALGSV
ncbi:MAG: fluoride efflux transporter CrcB [Nocardioidaceae bacterium]